MAGLFAKLFGGNPGDGKKPKYAGVDAGAARESLSPQAEAEPVDDSPEAQGYQSLEEVVDTAARQARADLPSRAFYGDTSDASLPLTGVVSTEPDAPAAGAGAAKPSIHGAAYVFQESDFVEKEAKQLLKSFENNLPLDSDFEEVQKARKAALEDSISWVKALDIKALEATAGALEKTPEQFLTEVLRGALGLASGETKASLMTAVSARGDTGAGVSAPGAKGDAFEAFASRALEMARGRASSPASSTSASVSPDSNTPPTSPSPEM